MTRTLPAKRRMYGSASMSSSAFSTGFTSRLCLAGHGGTTAPLSIEGVQLAAVALEDRPALQLERGCEHAVVGREVLERDDEILHPLVALDRLAAGLDLVAEELADLLAARDVLERNPLLPGPATHRLRLRDHERDVVRLVGAVDHHVGDEGRELQQLLEGRRHDVLAVLQLVLLLDPAGDEEVALGIEVAHVARAEAVVLHQDCGVLFGPVMVAPHDVRAADDDLAVDGIVRHRAIDLDRHAGNRAPDAAHLAVAGIVRGGDGAGLGEAIALVDRDPEGVDERRHLRAEGGAAADRVLESPAKAPADGR